MNAVLVVAALVVAELVLRARDPVRAVPYAVHPPDLSVTVTVDPHVTFGVQGDARFDTNALGMRGPLPEAGDASRIVALGGSTTECFVLSLEESWPWQLGRLLSERSGRQVWVGNAGRAGRSSRQHYFDARYMVPELGRVDVALLMVGINDLFNRMIQGTAFDAVDVEALDREGSYIRTALEVSDTGQGWLDGLHLVRRGRLALESVKLLSPRERRIRSTLNHTLPEFYVWARQMRAFGRIVGQVPPMEEALAEFERNLSLTLETLRRNGTIPVLVTQPALWRADLDVRERATLWLGSADGWPPREEGGPYYDVPAMAAMLEMYNDVLRRLAGEGRARLVDLAALMRADLTTFYDDVHFNEAGSRRVAEILAEALLADGVVPAQ